MHEADRAFRELAATRWGAASCRAAHAVGMTGHLLRRRIRDGIILAPTSKVLVLNGVPSTYELDAWVGLIEAGEDSAISHEGCLDWWGLPGFSRWPIDVTTGRAVSQFGLDAVTLHRSHLWPARHRIEVNGLRVATPTRAIFDVLNAGEVHLLKLERTINTAWARGLTSGRLLNEMAQEWCERGRRGSTWIHEYLDTHPIDWEPPASNLEARFSRVIVEAGMPEPKRQRNLGDDHSWIGRVDMVDPELPLIAEINSDRFHIAPLDAKADELRYKKLRSAGFEVEPFTEFEVWHRRDVVIDRWRAARRRVRDTTR